MNRKMVLYTIGQIVRVEAFLLLLPTVVALLYRDNTIWAFLLSVGIALALGTALTLLFRPTDRVIYAKEGFITVSLAWLLLAAIGALPFFISGEIPSYTNAFFETVSGLTTTGASILTDVESMSHSLLFWRSFTHWIGGMGVLVLMMAISTPTSSERSIHIMRAEMPGPVIGKLVPRAKETAKILYLIYIFMTVVQVVFLLFGGMSLFDSIVHAFGTAGTGGFGIKADSIAGYTPYLQWVITIFMVLFGINFNLYYLVLIGRFRAVFRSTELWCYIAIVLISTGIITANISPLYNSVNDAIRASAFQVSSIITTTGYATTDFNLWPGLSKSILFVLMFIGGCTGSTAGGLKITRVIMLFKRIRQELRRLLHPRSVSTMKFEGKTVDEATSGGVMVYFAMYMMLFFVIFLLISFEPFNFETTFSATAACFNNVGPGFGAVGPAASFADFSMLSKWVLCAAMLLGRLEIFPLILALSPTTWSKKHN